jgi:hypothetical protein
MADTRIIAFLFAVILATGAAHAQEDPDARFRLNLSSPLLIGVSNGPQACMSPWGEDVAHGGQVAFYAAATVAAGQSCVATQASCDNGEFSVSIPASASPTCSVESYSDGSPLRAVAIKSASERLIAALRQLVSIPGRDCNSPSCGNFYSALESTSLVPEGFTRTGDAFQFPAHDLTVQVVGIAKYSDTNIQFRINAIKGSDCAALLADPPDGQWLAMIGSVQRPIIHLDTPEKIAAYCGAPEQNISLVMFFNRY